MRQSLGPLGDIDMLTDKELKEAMGHHFDRVVRDWYRGIDYLGFAGSGNSSGTFTIPGADQGYTWDVRLVSAQLSAAGTLSIYPGDTTNVAPIGSVLSIVNGANNECVMRWSSNQAVIKDGRNITIFSASTILNWRLIVKQVPTEMQGKL